MKTAKLFANGRSQAVRLPVEFRFEGTEVFIRRDEITGEIILSKTPGLGTLGDYLNSRIDVGTTDFMDDRPLNTNNLFNRDVFGDDK